MNTSKNTAPLLLKLGLSLDNMSTNVLKFWAPSFSTCLVRLTLYPNMKGPLYLDL